MAFALALCALLSAADDDDAQDPPQNYWTEDENTGLGLFGYSSLSPFASLRTGLGPRQTSSMHAGDIELRINEDWARMLSVKHDFLLDYDVLRSNLGLSWSPVDGLRLDADFETATRTTGYLDTFIVAFHRTFNLSIGNRRQYLHHPQRIELEPSGSPRILVDQTDPQPNQQSIILGAQYTLTRGDDVVPAIDIGILLRRKLDSGDVHDDGNPDVAGTLSLSKSLGPFCVYVGGSAAWFGDSNFFGLPLRPLQWSGVFGVEIRVLDWWSITGQYLITSGGVDSMNALSRPSHEVIAGFKWDLGAGFLLETAIQENIINPYSSPDFGVHLGLLIRW